MTDREPGIPSDALTWTGERYIPGMGGRIEVEHLHRYAMALQLAQGKDVLDIACGEGYGTHLLSTVARFAAGVDISSQAIGHASQAYQSANLEFRNGSCASIPYSDRSFDLVVSFETIEHHDQHHEMMREFRRVLRQGGLLLISSPDKLHYAGCSGDANPFHVKELCEEEFLQLLQSCFRHVTLYGQKICFGSLIAPRVAGMLANGFASAAGDARSISTTDCLHEPSYLIALASQENLVALSTSFWETTPTQADLASTAAFTGLQSVYPFGHYRLGDVIDFRLGGNAPLFQRSGWDMPTAGGSWTVGPKATLHLRMIDWQSETETTPMTIEVQAQGLISAAHPQTLIELHVNHQLVGVAAFGEFGVLAWPFALATGDAPTAELLITFSILNAASPRTLGLSEDPRHLGLLLTQINLTVSKNMA